MMRTGSLRVAMVEWESVVYLSTPLECNGDNSVLRGGEEVGKMIVEMIVTGFWSCCV